MCSITPAELKEIEELDRLEWQDDIIEKVQQEAQEKFQEKLKEQKKLIHERYFILSEKQTDVSCPLQDST